MPKRLDENSLFVVFMDLRKRLRISFTKPYEMMKRGILTFLAVACSSVVLHAVPGGKDNLNYPAYSPQSGDVTISRAEYHHKLRGFWMGQCIANWTGLTAEGQRTDGNFYTDSDWGVTRSRFNQVINFVVDYGSTAWKSDDDTDVEYMYQRALYDNNKSILSPVDIRNAWLSAIRVQPGTGGREPEWLWVSNRRAWQLMLDGYLPPETSNPSLTSDGSEGNLQNFYNMIDAQLTTEIFGLFAPARLDTAQNLASLPILTTARAEAEAISRFYVNMHSLASVVDRNMSMRDQTRWLAHEARKQMPSSWATDMFDFVWQDYLDNPDKNDWERTRDAIYVRYQQNDHAGYQYARWFDAGINFAAGMVSWFYGEGDFRRTLQIGTLAGWDCDNPTATWGGLLGFMLGVDQVSATFGGNVSELFKISVTRNNFPDRTPGLDGEDTFSLMADRGIHIIDRVIIEEMGGGVDLANNLYHIPGATPPEPGETNIASQATIIASVTNPIGGGSQSLEVIRDGIKPPVGSTSNTAQYDTYAGPNGQAQQYIGYTFSEDKAFTRLVYQEGKHFGDGGWFANGSIVVQVLQGTSWVTVPATLDRSYPNGNSAGTFGSHYETYVFTLSNVVGSGIRVYGEAGGSARFISAGELEVYGETATQNPDTGNIASQATIIASVTNPTGGGSKNLEVIRDGIKPPVGSTSNTAQYDTYAGPNGQAQQYIGYTFSEDKAFTRLVYQEGKHFGDGGWFANGSIVVQVLQGASWVTVPAALDQAYPNGSSVGTFGSHYETYVFTLNNVVGSGIRVYGEAGGSARFISVGELEVYGETSTGGPGGPQEPTNLVVNGSFENGSAPWALSNNAAVSTASSQDGNSSLRVAQPFAMGRQTLDVDIGVSYELSVWVNASGVTSGPWVFDTNDRYDETCQFVGGANSGWTQYTGTFIATQEELIFRAFGEATFAGAVYFDNITLTEITTASASFAEVSSSALFSSSEFTEFEADIVLYGADSNEAAVSYVSTPLRAESVYTGVINLITSDSIGVAGSPWNAGQFNGSEGLYYIEIAASEAGVGMMADIIDNTSNTLVIGHALSDVLALGDSFVIRPHLTVSDVFGNENQAGLASSLSGDSDSADVVVLFNNDTKASDRIWYSAVSGAEGWVEDQGNDASDYVIYPEQGFTVERLSSQGLIVSTNGEAPMVAPVYPVFPGRNLLPVPGVNPVSLSDLGMFTGDVATGIRGNANYDATVVDKLVVVDPNGDEQIYWYSTNSNGSGWMDISSASAGDVQLMPGTSFILFRGSDLSAFNWITSQ